MATPRHASHTPRSRPPQIAIVGAGFAGIGLAMRLRMRNHDAFTIFDKADDFGGVWRDNTYPGAGCDVPSHLYSFSFARKATWTRHFPKQPEILDYLHQCVRQFDLRANFRPNTEIRSARWNEAERSWTLTAANGDRHTADHLVLGLGQLSRPRWPTIEGLDTFQGTTFHSARWNHDHDLSGERVAVIGNGASAVQFVPEIVGDVEMLYQFQREPNWMLPKPDAPFTAEEIARFQKFPGLERLHRTKIYATFEARFGALRANSRAAAIARDMAQRTINHQVPDPALRAVLTPHYPVGCKRILISNDYLPALGRDNVEVVTDPITAVTPDAVVTADGTHRAVDTIIAATGFSTSNFLGSMQITGRGGQDLAATWRDGASAYRGIAVPSFPNLYFQYGPNTNLGHNSIVFMLEGQFRWILDAIDHSVANGGRPIEVRPQAAQRWDAKITKALSKTVWEGDCSSWYKDARGRVVNNWPSWTFSYWAQTRHVRTQDLVH